MTSLRYYLYTLLAILVPAIPFTVLLTFVYYGLKLQ